MTAVEHLLSAPGGELQNVVVCRVCERADPDMARLRKGLGLPFYSGISRGAHVSVACGHPDHGPCACVAPVEREQDGDRWRCRCALCGQRWTVPARPSGGDA